jgi:D-alanine-D-alanine ligase-like ATP-grasp enzyme
VSAGRLILVFEPEEACRLRLLRDGFAPAQAAQIASYLAQSTDIAADLDALGDACGAAGLGFLPVALDEAPPVLASADTAADLVWTLTDGIAYFRGGAAPALARLHGLRTVGADDSLFALAQDKLRSGAVLRALGLPAPQGGLARDGKLIVPPPASASGYFVKPNRLGAKIGIWPDSRCDGLDAALALSRRIAAEFRDDAVIQPYLPGRNVRASFLAAAPGAGAERLGVFFVDSGGDFQTMADSLALYGGTGEAAKAVGSYREPELLAVRDAQPEADRAIRAIASRMAEGLGLRDVFSLDLRVEADETVHLIEFEVCPGLPCFDFRAYCRTEWGMTLAEAMAQAALTRRAASGAPSRETR